MNGIQRGGIVALVMSFPPQLIDELAEAPMHAVERVMQHLPAPFFNNVSRAETGCRRLPNSPKARSFAAPTSSFPGRPDEAPELSLSATGAGWRGPHRQCVA